MTDGPGPKDERSHAQGVHTEAGHDRSGWRHIDDAAEQHGVETASMMSFRAASAPFDGADTAMVMEQLLSSSAARTEAEFEMLDKLGEGGMGVVMRARQIALSRQVAIKRLVVADEAHQLAFMSEAQIMGRLDHANIVPVHTLTTAEGAPLLAMKLVEGSTWSDLIHRQQTPLDEHLRIFEGVCNAMAFAHSRGMLHRDLKPDNVAIGSFGQVFVMDWGVAAALTREAAEQSSIFTVSEVPGPVGTPCYMPPELASGEGSAQSERTDVYLLGACLHEALTKRRLHHGDSMQALRDAALRSEPPRYGPEVPAELAELCRRAMARDPAERFASVEALMLALTSYREHTAARALIADGETLAGQLAELVARSPARSDEGGDSDALAHDGRVQALYQRASYALERALELWPEAPARSALAELHEQMLERALAAEDVGQARRLAVLVGSPQARQRAEALAERAQERARELVQLRLAQRQRSWDLVARPLGSCYLLSGAVGAVASLGSMWAQQLPRQEMLPIIATSWLAVLFGSGAFALWRLRQIKLPGYLISPRAFGGWAAVGAAIAINGMLGVVRQLTPFADAHVSALLLGVGFAATAMQTRYWLLGPAAVWFAGALAMGLSPDESNIFIFGLLWTVTMGGVGLALWRGAQLDPHPSEPT